MLEKRGSTSAIDACEAKTAFSLEHVPLKPLIRGHLEGEKNVLRFQESEINRKCSFIWQQ